MEDMFRKRLNKDVIKLVVFAMLAITLVVMCLFSAKSINSEVAFEQLDDSVLACLMSLTFIWVSLSSILAVDTGKGRMISSIIRIIGQVAITIFSIESWFDLDKGNYLAKAAINAGNYISVVIETINSRLPWFIVLILVLVTGFFLFNISARVVIYGIAIAIVYYAIKGMNSIALSLVLFVGFIVIFEIVLKVFVEKDHQDDPSDDEELSISFFKPNKIDIIILCICAIVFVVLLITGKVYSWKEYLGIVFSNDYLDMSEVSGKINNAVILVSTLVSFALGSFFSRLVEALSGKIGELHGKKDNVWTGINNTLIQANISILLIDYLTAFLLAIYNQDIKEVKFLEITEHMPKSVLDFGEILNDVYCNAVDIAPFLGPALFIIVILIAATILIVSFVIINGSFFLGWIALIASIFEGLVFMYVVNFTDNLLSVNIMLLGPVIWFIAYYILNNVASVIADNAVISKEQQERMLDFIMALLGRMAD